MAIKITQTADCNKLVITVISPDAGANHTVKVSNDGGTYEYTFAGGQDNVRVVNASQVSGKNGIYLVEHFSDGTLLTKGAILFACDVLCCIASKLNELLDCDCDCNKCSPHFVEAQKIFLLLKTAEADLANAGDNGNTLEQIQAVIDNAEEKYKTAQDMCAGHCGCNC
jgi:hypothetical protein